MKLDIGGDEKISAPVERLWIGTQRSRSPDALHPRLHEDDRNLAGRL